MKKYREGIFIITYRKEKNKISYLLLKRKLHWKGWEFPKGGVEKNENLMQTARRECEEETGQKPRLLVSLSYSGKYKYHQKLKDRPSVVGQTWKLFAAEIKNERIKFDKREHSDYNWFEYKDAVKKLSWPNQRKCLEIVHKTIF